MIDSMEFYWFYKPLPSTYCMACARRGLRWGIDPLCSSISIRPGRSQELGKWLPGGRRISAFRLPFHWKLQHQFFPRSAACCSSLQILDLSVSIIAWTNSLKINFSVYLSSYIHTHILLVLLLWRSLTNTNFGWAKATWLDKLGDEIAGRCVAQV